MIIVCDIGGTKARIGMSKDGRSLSSAPVVIETPATFKRGIHTLTSTIEKISGGQKIEAIVIAIAGVLSYDKSYLMKSFHLSGWVNEPLAKTLSDYFNTKVLLVNDAALAGLGEAVFGAGKGHKIVVYMTISTGVGGVKIVDGKIEETTIGFEPGYQIIDWQNNLSLEDLASGYSLQNKYKQHPKELVNTEVWGEVEKALSVGIHNMIVLWSPDIVILGGSMSNDLDPEKLKKMVISKMKIFPSVSEIVKGNLLKDEAALLGGLVYLGLNQKNS